ncbi:MAG: SPOR domain-containing protein [Bdellovibrio sp.]|nr:SPOR domain-containing protein [Methylotenera sp.]
MQKETVGEQELNLKKRARRRLVGAIALVLLMIIVLPMILKNRAATSPQDKITISLPGEQQTITPTAPGDFDSNIVPAEPASQALPSSETTPIPTTNSKTETKPEPSEPAAQIADTEAAAEQNEMPTPAKSAPAKEVQPMDTVKPKVEISHRFYVQVGVFSDEANVKQLQGKLSDLGYKSQTEKIDTAKGKKIRLRTQLFKDRNEAAIALENIKDAGLTGMVVSQ